MTIKIADDQFFIKASFKAVKKNLLSYLCLAYFAVYAISPLSYTFTAGQTAEGISGAHGMLIPGKGLNIFLLELIYSKIDDNREIDKSNPPVTVLIRKTRAILTENTNSRLAPFGNPALSEDAPSLSNNFSPSRLISCNRQNSGQLFNPFHSGLSPPPA